MINGKTSPLSHQTGHVNDYKHFCPFLLDRVTSDQMTYWIATIVTWKCSSRVKRAVLRNYWNLVNSQPVNSFTPPENSTHFPHLNRAAVYLAGSCQTCLISQSPYPFSFHHFFLLYWLFSQTWCPLDLCFLRSVQLSVSQSCARGVSVDSLQPTVGQKLCPVCMCVLLRQRGGINSQISAWPTLQQSVLYESVCTSLFIN